MTEDKKSGNDNGLNARVTRLETIVQFHDIEIKELKGSLEELKAKIDALNENLSGFKYVFERIVLPILITVLTALILKKI